MNNLARSLIFLSILQHIRGQTTPSSLEYKPTRPFYAPNPIRYPQPIIRTSTASSSTETTSKITTPVTQQIQNASTEFENRINIPESSKVEEKNTSGSIVLDYKPIKPFYLPTIPYPQPHPWFTKSTSHPENNEGTFIKKTTTEIKEKFKEDNPSNGTLTNALLQLEELLEDARKEMLSETSPNKTEPTPTLENNNDTPLDLPNRIGQPESIATPDYYTTQETILTSGILVLDHGKGSKVGTTFGLNLESTTQSNQFVDDQGFGTSKKPLGESNEGFSTPGISEYKPPRTPFPPIPVRYPQAVNPSDDTNPSSIETTTSSMGFDYKASRPPFAHNSVNHNENTQSSLIHSNEGPNLGSNFGAEPETVSSSVGLEYESSKPPFVPSAAQYPQQADHNENIESPAIHPIGGSDFGSIQEQESEASYVEFEYKPSRPPFAPNSIEHPQPVNNTDNTKPSSMHPTEVSNFGIESQTSSIGLEHKSSRPPFAPNPIKYPQLINNIENTQSSPVQPTEELNFGTNFETEPETSPVDLQYKPTRSPFIPNPVDYPQPVKQTESADSLLPVEPSGVAKPEIVSEMHLETSSVISLEYKPSRPPFAPNPIYYPKPIDHTHSSSLKPTGESKPGFVFGMEHPTSSKPSNPSIVPNPVNHPKPLEGIDGFSSTKGKPGLVYETTPIISLEYKPSRPPYAPNPVQYPKPVGETPSGFIKPHVEFNPGSIFETDFSTSKPPRPTFVPNPVQNLQDLDQIDSSGGEPSSKKPDLNEKPTTASPTLEYKPSRPPFVLNPTLFPQGVNQTYSPSSAESNPGSGIGLQSVTTPITLDYKPSQPPFAPNPVYYPLPVTQENPVPTSDTFGYPQQQVTSSTKSPVVLQNSTPPSLEYKPTRPPYAPNPIQYPQPIRPFTSSAIVTENVSNLPLDYETRQSSVMVNPVVYPGPTLEESNTSSENSSVIFPSAPQPTVSSSIPVQSSVQRIFPTVIPATVIVSENGSIIVVPEHQTSFLQDFLQGSTKSNIPEGSTSLSGIPQPSSNPIVYPEHTNPNQIHSFIQNSTPKTLPSSVEFHQTLSKDLIQKPSYFEGSSTQQNPSLSKTTTLPPSLEDSSSSSEEDSSSSEESETESIPYHHLKDISSEESTESSHPQSNSPVPKLLKKPILKSHELTKDWSSKDISPTQQSPKLLLGKPFINPFIKSGNLSESKRTGKILKKLVINHDNSSSYTENKN